MKSRQESDNRRYSDTYKTCTDNADALCGFLSRPGLGIPYKWNHRLTKDQHTDVVQLTRTTSHSNGIALASAKPTV